jgi:predicted CopG family antitoxin
MGVGIMPVIAINVSKKVYDMYHNMKKGKRSEHFNNILERQLRIQDLDTSRQSHKDLEHTIAQLQIANEKLQTLLLEAQDVKQSSRSLIQTLRRLFNRRNN